MISIKHISLFAAFSLTVFTAFSAEGLESREVSIAEVSIAEVSIAEVSIAVEDSGADQSLALELSRAYLAGMSAGESLDALDSLFVSDERSSVYENGSNEGTWLHYKDHHLAPEQESVKDFQFTSTSESVEPCGDGFLALHIGEFTLTANGEKLTYRAAVSFMLVQVEGELRILHLHWSSRKIG